MTRAAWILILIVACVGVALSIFTHGTTVAWIPCAMVAVGAGLRLREPDREA